MIARKGAADSIAFYGEMLFRDLFDEDKARQEWRKLVLGLETLRVQVISDMPPFHALHWEALKDPEEEKPFCLGGVEFVRTSSRPTHERPIKESSCLNLLMVTARPGGKDDIEYRTITRPVIEALEDKRMRVCVHLLRPPTLKQLKHHLRARKGFYHIDIPVCHLLFAVRKIFRTLFHPDRETGKMP
jgi:hypothetical protein